MTHDINIHIEADHESASTYLVSELKHLRNKVNSKFSIGLSGGNTPKLAYSKMLESFVDFADINFWTVDERWVDDKNEFSNQKLIDSYFDKTDANILKFEFSNKSPYDDAMKYEDKLKDNIDIYDVVILGLGEDGHIASLFPGTEALENNDFLYTANEVNIKTKWRVTSTYKLLGSVRKIFVLATGTNKKNILSLVNKNETLPINILKNYSNNIEIITDQII